METEKNRTSAGPPAPQLKAGHLLDGKIEIMRFIMADGQKNVYAGQEDMDSVILLERWEQKDMLVSEDIPQECISFYPHDFRRLLNSDREYMVFNPMEGRFLDHTTLKCLEPELVCFLYNLASALMKLDENHLDITGISLKDIFVTSKGVTFITFPEKTETGNNVEEMFSSLFERILFKKVKPSLTRNLEKPFQTLALSEEFQMIIQDIINQNLSPGEFLSELAKFKVPDPDVWHIRSITDVGQAREHNEDACGWISKSVHTDKGNYTYTVLAVSDGMGGHQKGEIASCFAICEWMKKITEGLEDLSDSEFENTALKALIETTFDKTQEAFSNQEDIRNIPEQLRPGATLTGGVIVNRLVFTGNCGDSRAYLIRAGNIERITKDHSLMQRYIDRGEITEYEASEHEQRNIITSFIGVNSRMYKRDVYVRYLPENSCLLFCSDGLSGMLNDNEISDIIFSSENVKAGAERLIQAANEKGGDDNITAVLAADHLFFEKQCQFKDIEHKEEHDG
ncbi:MAG: serine/threonine-protein phosphatase [Desulfobacterales bacterium]|nr:serine/threonine-protein phosphatase [Desulfobacterales bacterium]